MKRNIATLLVACVMFLTLFVGCQQRAVTPTDIVDKVVPSLENSTEGNEDVAPSKDGSEEKVEPVPTTNSSKENKSDSSKVVSSQSVTKSKQDENSNSSYQCDIVIEHPTFTTEKELKNWFLGNGPASYEKDLPKALSALSDSKTLAYYRPLEALETKGFHLDKIEMQASTGNLTYTYGLKNSDAKLLVCADNSPDDAIQRAYKAILADYQAKLENASSYTHEGITYYCDYSPKAKQTIVLWKQFGYARMASVVGYDEPIEELIPLLKIEQVTLDLTSDKVTQ